MAPIGGPFLPVYHNVNDSIAKILCGLSYFISDKAIQKSLSWALTFIHTNTYQHPFCLLPVHMADCHRLGIE